MGFWYLFPMQCKKPGSVGAKIRKAPVQEANICLVLYS